MVQRVEGVSGECGQQNSVVPFVHSFPGEWLVPKGSLDLALVGCVWSPKLANRQDDFTVTRRRDWVDAGISEFT